MNKQNLIIANKKLFVKRRKTKKKDTPVMYLLKECHNIQASPGVKS